MRRHAGAWRTLTGGVLALAFLTACAGESGSTAPSVGPSRSAEASSTPSASPTPSPTATPMIGAPVGVRLELVARGLSDPIGITNAADGTGRLFINEQGGRVRVVDASGTLQPDPFVDLSDRLEWGGERGLLGLAFHPDFASNGRLFVDYTRRGDGATVISELRTPADRSSADAASERILLVIPQPYANHNGGQIAFGPDGYLYIGMGDGGSGGDPHGNGQERGVLLGKILRLDVNSSPPPGKAYAIPEDNPFAPGGAHPGDGLPEIWAYGLRNPWRFSFDRGTGDLYIGDVGQGSWEEVDRQPQDSPGGENYGWNTMEASHCYEANACSRSGLTLPIAEYPHGVGCSITGGYVYRGTTQPLLAGIYVFADLCAGMLFTLSTGGDLPMTTTLIGGFLQVSSFGEDEAGELYLVNYSRGDLYRVVADPQAGN